MRDPIELLGVPFHPWTRRQTLDEIARRMAAGEMVQHGVINVAKLVEMRRDPALFDAVSGCDIVNADGMGVVWGARFLGLDVPERVAGIDLFHDLLALAEREGLSVFFLGARQEVLDQAVARLRTRHPGLRVAGAHHGYFWDDEERVVRLIAETGADMLFVAISPPKKEKFIGRWGRSLGVRFVMGVGGTFDVVAGVTRRAPRWMQACGLEWLYRLLQEPRRMWRRYLSSNAEYARLLVREKFTSPRRREGTKGQEG